MLALGSLNPTVKPNNLLKIVYHSVHCLLHLYFQIELQKVKDVLLLIHSHFQTFSLIEREGVIK